MFRTTTDTLLDTLIRIIGIHSGTSSGIINKAFALLRNLIGAIYVTGRICMTFWHLLQIEQRQAITLRSMKA